LAVPFIGCGTLPVSHLAEGYETQKRIVWQGRLTVTRGSDGIHLIYFGYDRNGDLTRLTETSACRGVDLLEYKSVSADGRWRHNPVTVLLDDDYDCYADRVLYDCDGDGVFEKAAHVSGRAVRLEVLNKAHHDCIDRNCLSLQRFN
jgi:hypothetical protein